MATYVIGDIHGRSDFLRELVELQLPVQPEDSVVFIGDYIDRGGDSRGVIDLLLDYRDRYRCIFLRGNHEDMFMQWLGLDAVGHPVLPNEWLRSHGGDAALQSYGVSTSGLMSGFRLQRLRKKHDWLPAEHLDFLQSTLLIHRDDHACYVHAGFRPGVPIAEQSPPDLLTIRQGWVDVDHPMDQLVVHGHTPTPYDGGELRVRILSHRINIDTGCGRHPQGFLSAVRLPDQAVFTVGDRQRGSL